MAFFVMPTFKCLPDENSGQVCKDKKISDYFFAGKALSTEHISELTALLTDEGIPIPSSSDSFVTDSTISPFSEKLMINHLGILSSSGITSVCVDCCIPKSRSLVSSFTETISR